MSLPEVLVAFVGGVAMAYVIAMVVIFITWCDENDQ